MDAEGPLQLVDPQQRHFNLLKELHRSSSGAVFEARHWPAVDESSVILC